jgi:hypothetical protein
MVKCEVLSEYLHGMNEDNHFKNQSRQLVSVLKYGPTASQTLGRNANRLTTTLNLTTFNMQAILVAGLCPSNVQRQKFL